METSAKTGMNVELAFMAIARSVVYVCRSAGVFVVIE